MCLMGADAGQWDAIVPCPHNRILVCALTQELGRLPVNAKHKKTPLLGPSACGIATLTFVDVVGQGVNKRRSTSTQLSIDPGS